MKTNFLKSAALIALLSFSNSLMAQEATPASTTSTVKPFAPASMYRTWSFGLSAGVLTPVTFSGKNDFSDWETSLGYGGYIKNQILPALGIRADFLRGDLAAKNSVNGAYSSFKTQINWSAALSAEFTLANINWLHKTSVIRPYLSAGAGVMGYKPTLTTTAGAVQTAAGDKFHELLIPIGAGLKFQVAKGVNFDIGYNMNLTDVDNLDGLYFGPQADKFSYGHAGLEFALGDKSKPMLAGNNPVKVMYDDYTALNDDLKAQLAAEKTSNANNAALLAQLQQQFNDAFKDTDGDGVIDKLDKCPGTTAGVKVDGSGCPLPENKPDTKIYITEEDKKVVRDAINNLEFDFGKATIRSKSFESLNRVANLLVDKNFSLKLAGHTDNVGSDAANLKLSKDRAESVKSYLVSKGANPSRVEATGYGESQPIASNKTDAGRQQNRRVEFTLY